MDFLTSVFDTEKIEEGAWLHLTGPDDEPLYLDGKAQTQPSRIKVRSTSSTHFDKFLDNLQRRAADRTKSARGKKGREEMLRSLKKERPESFSALVVSMENVSLEKPGEITPPREDLMRFAANPHNKWCVDQVLEFAADDRNYGGADDEEEEEPDDKSVGKDDGAGRAAAT